MKMLIIDTSQKIGVLSLYQESIGFQTIEIDSQNQQKLLINSLDSLVKDVTINFIAICIGPGSFTGTRIGVMTAKGLSYAKNIPLHPFNSLLPYHTPNTLTLLDAKHDHAFVFNGSLLEKLPYIELQTSLLPLFSPYPEAFPFPVNQSHYQLESLLSLTPKSSLQLIY